MTIRPVEPRDLLEIATIHKAQFRTHFLGQFSLHLISAYYGSFLHRSIFLLEESGNKVNGFVLGDGLEELRQCVTSFFKNHWRWCLWDTLLRPRLWIESPRRALRQLVPSRPAEKRPPKSPEETLFRLLSIAVSEKAMGTGVAAALIRAFEEKIEHFADTYDLSVGKTNGRAIRFYEKAGFEIIQDNSSYLVLRKKLRSHGLDSQPK
jgi:ribosomal protein S18 acetylase RimI-like enzyme